MATITIQLDDSILMAALNQASEQKTSLENYMQMLISGSVLNLNQTEQTEQTLENVLNNVIKKTKELNLNQTYALVDLFSKKEWENLNGGIKKQLGKLYRKNVEHSKLAQHVGRNSANHSLYQKIC